MLSKIVLFSFFTIVMSSSLTLKAEDNLKETEGDYKIQNYTFRNGETLDNLNLHYTTLGTPQKDAQGNITNAVLLLHPTTSSGVVFLTPEFKKYFFAEGKPLDANKYYLIFPDSIGAGKSSKPSNGLRMQFPHYGYRDMVDLQHKLVFEKLGVKHLKYVLGTSMGGMHTWLWAVLYPDDMDGAMPVASLPVKVTGRNLLWREAFINNVKKDPNWNNGNYTTEPSTVQSGWVYFLMLLEGVAHMQNTLTDTKAINAFIDKAEEEGSKKDANDLIYVIGAVTDYDPESDLGKIKASVYALNFTDDQLNPYYLRILEDNITKVKHGKAFVQQGTAETYGHLTFTHPDLWANQVMKFKEYVDSNQNK